MAPNVRRVASVAPIAKGASDAFLIFTESLILAQDERLRRA